MPPVPDGYDCFRELIQELRHEHFDEVAGKIDLLLNHVAWTTGSEFLVSFRMFGGQKKSYLADAGDYPSPSNVSTESRPT